MNLPGLRPAPRKLNMSFVRDMTKAATAASLAFGYEEFVASQIVRKTLLDQRISAPEFLLNFLVGWAPLAGAAAMHREGDTFWPAFAGAVAYNRADNLGAAFGLTPTTPMVSTQNVPARAA